VATGVEQTSDAGRALLHLAGPYTPVGAWFEASRAPQRRPRRYFDRCGAPPAAKVHQALEQIGMAPGSVTAYLSSHQQVRWIGERFVLWGDTAAVRAEAILHARGTPATLDEIHAAIGDIGISASTLQGMLFHEEQFVRTSRRQWGLRAWDVEEYSGIADAIGARVDRAGGRMRVAELLDDMQTSFPDIAESSIKAYTHTPAFVIEDDWIRRRTRRDRWPEVPDLNSVRGAFRNGDSEIRLAFPVNHDMLRGSGLALPAAADLGVQPTWRREFTGPHGTVRVMWPLSSSHGAQVGSCGRRPARWLWTTETPWCWRSTPTPGPFTRSASVPTPPRPSGYAYTSGAAR
jgi:hypothetical protein